MNPEKHTRNTSLKMDRRGFLSGTISGSIGTALTSAGNGLSGLTLGFFLSASSGLSDAEAAGAATQVNTWLNIGMNGSVSLTIGASEMGQGSFSGLAQMLAEELMVDYAKVTLLQGSPTLTSPAPIGSYISNVGGGVTRNNFWKLRDAAAIARETLVNAGMARVGDPARGNCTVEAGVIRHMPSGTLLGYGDVAAAAALLTPPASAPLVPDSQFVVIGKPLQRPDIPLKVDGSARYGIDVRVPGMVYAVIEHCPAFGGKLAATPATPAGMIAVVATEVKAGKARGLEAVGDVNAVAVVGPNIWDTWQAAKRLTVRWTLPSNAATLNSAQFLADAQTLMATAVPFLAGAANPAGTLYTVERSTADANAAIAAAAAAAKMVDATCSLPYASHACTEVLNCMGDCVARVLCEVRAPTQTAKSALSLIATLTGLPSAKIILHTTYLGGGLGLKAEQDFISQAVQVGMALQRPVQLMWPRKGDFTLDQYRPMALISVRAGMDANACIAGWSYRNVSPSILAQRGTVLGATGDSQGYEASQNLPYTFGSRRATANLPSTFG